MEPDDGALAADALRAAGIVEGDAELAFTHPLVAGALRASIGAGELGRWHARAAAMLAAEGTDPERVALHVLRTDPAADPETVALLRAAAERALARGAPESAATFLRRALIEPPVEPALAADVRLELGLALAAHVLPDAPRLLGEAVELAASPEQRVAIALRGGRALGMAGHFEDALHLCRRGLEHAADVTPAAAARLEAELISVASAASEHGAEARARLAHPVVPRETLELWRPNAAAYALFGGEPARDALGLLGPLLEDDALAAEPDSLLHTVTALVLIHGDELDAVCARCTELIDLARPRGWLIALAHGSFLRAIALLRAGRVREAEIDARHSFDFKSRHSALHALLWSLYPLVGALTEADEPEAADAALAATGLGDPPAGALTSPLLLQSRARLRLAQHRPEDALADARDAAGRWEEFGHHHPGFATWRVEAVEALVALGEPAAARPLAEEHLALAERVGLPGPDRRRSARGGPRRGARRARRAARARRGPCSPTAPRSSSTRARSSTSARRCAARTGGRTPARRCGSRSSSPSTTACGCSPAERAKSSTLRARARAGPRSPDRRRSRPPSTASRASRPTGPRTARSPSSSTSRSARSRRTSPTRSRSSTSGRARIWQWH